MLGRNGQALVLPPCLAIGWSLSRKIVALSRLLWLTLEVTAAGSCQLSANSVPYRYMVNSSLKGELSHVPPCLPQSTLRAAWNHFSKPVQSSCGPLFLRGNVEELVRGKNYSLPCCSFSQSCHWFSSSPFSTIHSIFILIFCLFILSIIDKRMLNSPIIIASVFISPCNSQFCLTYFDALLLGTYMLTMVMSS